MKRKAIEIVTGADLHGTLPTITATDLLLLVGDLFPWQNHDLDYQRRWQQEVLLPWLDHQPAREKVLVAGNHDFLWQEERPRGNFHYLEDEGIELYGWRIWGTPWTPPQKHNSRQWAFKEPEKSLRKRFSKIPSDTDILLSHGPPWGILDWTGRRHVGSDAMLLALQATDPALFICGHIHESGGSAIWKKTAMINATIRDRDRRAGSMWSVDLRPESLVWARGALQ